MKKRIIAIGVVLLLILAVLVIYFASNNEVEEPVPIDPWEGSINLDINEHIQFIQEVKDNQDKNNSLKRRVLENLSQEEIQNIMEEIKSLNLSSRAEYYLLNAEEFNIPSQEELDKLKVIDGSKAVLIEDYDYSSCEIIWEMDSTYKIYGANYQTYQTDRLRKCAEEYLYTSSSKACPSPDCDTGSTYKVDLSEEVVSRIIL